MLFSQEGVGLKSPGQISIEKYTRHNSISKRKGTMLFSHNRVKKITRSKIALTPQRYNDIFLRKSKTKNQPVKIASMMAKVQCYYPKDNWY